MNTCGTSLRKVWNTDPSSNGRTAKSRRLTRTSVRWYRWSHREPHGLWRNPTHGETPLLKSYRSQTTYTVSKDVAREGRQCERDRQTRPTQRKGGGHAQDIARERTRTPPRRNEGWNGWVTLTGPQTEEQTRDRCRTPEGEEPIREARTLTDSRPQ